MIKKIIGEKLYYILIIYLMIVAYLACNYVGAMYLSLDSAIYFSAIAFSLICALFIKNDFKKTETNRLLTYDVFFSVCILMIGAYLTTVISDPYIEQYEQGLQQLSPGTLIFSVLILAPISEELLFRGIIYKYTYKLGVPAFVAAIISSIVFVLVHGTFSHVIPAFIMGMYFCLVYERTGNIIYDILCHSIYNIATLILGQFISTVTLPFAIIYTILFGSVIYIFVKENNKWQNILS